MESSQGQLAESLPPVEQTKEPKVVDEGLVPPNELPNSDSPNVVSTTEQVGKGNKAASRKSRKRKTGQAAKRSSPSGTGDTIKELTEVPEVPTSQDTHGTNEDSTSVEQDDGTAEVHGLEGGTHIEPTNRTGDEGIDGTPSRSVRTDDPQPQGDAPSLAGAIAQVCPAAFRSYKRIMGALASRSDETEISSLVITLEVSALFQELVTLSKKVKHLEDKQASSNRQVSNANSNASNAKSVQVPKPAAPSDFAAAAKRGAEKPQPKPKRRSPTKGGRANDTVLLVYPKGSTDTADSGKTRAAVTKAVCPRSLRMGIKSVRPIGKGGVKIVVRTKDDVPKLEGLLKDSDEVITKQPKAKFPQVILYGLPGEMKPEEVKSTLVEQNEILKAEDFRLLYKLDGRNKSTHWVAEVRPEAFKALSRSRRKLFFEWGTIRFKEYLKETQCFRCNQYGHVSRHCQNSQTCRRCDERGHSHKDCRAVSPKCTNCTKANERFRRGYDTAHSAYDPKCPSLAREKERLRAQVCYV